MARSAWTEGWLVTDKYDGSMQRYRIDGAPGDGLMGAHIGFFTLSGNDYYGRDNEGCVLRGLCTSPPSGDVYYGDDDGVLGDVPGLSGCPESLGSASRTFTAPPSTSSPLTARTATPSSSRVAPATGSPIFDWLCGVGLPQYNGGQGTIRGTYTIGGDGAYCNWSSDPDYSEYGNPYDYQTRYFAKDDIKWYTNFCLDLGFHSTIGWDGGCSDPNQIGKRLPTAAFACSRRTRSGFTSTPRMGPRSSPSSR